MRLRPVIAYAQAFTRTFKQATVTDEELEMHFERRLDFRLVSVQQLLDPPSLLVENLDTRNS